MDRTQAAGYVDIGGGKRGYRNRNAVGGIAGTVIDAADRNATQEELLAIIEAAGLTPSSTNLAQVLAACRKLFGGPGSLGAASWKMPMQAGLLAQGGKIALTAGQLPDFGGSWSQIAPSFTRAITFPEAFVTAPLFAGAFGLADASGNDASEVAFGISALSTTAVTFKGWRLSGNSGGGTDAGSFVWLAIGY